MSRPEGDGDPNEAELHPQDEPNAGHPGGCGVSHAPIATPTGGSAPRRVLEDESGRRLRGFRLVGRLIALLALVWLSLIVLGGLGVGPANHVPFGSALHIAAAPPPLRALPDPRPASAADLLPAVPATAVVPADARSTPSPEATSPATVTKAHVNATPGASPPKQASPGRSTAPHGRAATAPVKASPGAGTHVSAAPGQKAGTAAQVRPKPGTTSHGKSTSTGTLPRATTPATSRPGAGTAGNSSGALGRKKP